MDKAALSTVQHDWERTLLSWPGNSAGWPRKPCGFPTRAGGRGFPGELLGSGWIRSLTEVPLMAVGGEGRGRGLIVLILNLHHK